LKSISLITNTFGTTVKWSSSTLCATQIEPLPLRSAGIIWNTNVSSESLIIKLSALILWFKFYVDYSLSP